jgi:hypothetical protein
MPFDARQLAKEHEGTIAIISDLFHRKNISPETGEQILLYMAGMSAGLRMANVLDNSWTEPLARGYQIAVVYGDDIAPPLQPRG